MQTAIVVLIVGIAGFFLIRRFYNNLKKANQSTCGCGCDGCSPDLKDNCSEIDSQNQ